MNFIRFLLLGCILFLYGCAIPIGLPPVMSIDPDDFAVTKAMGYSYDDALKNEISISKIELSHSWKWWLQEIDKDSFYDAIKISLSTENLLNKKGKYQLEIKLEDISRPLFSVDYSVTTQIKYVLVERESKKVIMNSDISESFISTPDDSYIALKRGRIAISGSCNKNIKSFLKESSSLNLN